MATLEVHDSRGRVRVVSVAGDQPALIGSDPKCQIVLSDPEAKPFHARLRRRGERWTVEALPDAKELTINGQSMPAASIRAGDEIEIGSMRIFLVDESDAKPKPAKPVEPPRKPTPAAKPAATAAPSGLFDDLEDLEQEEEAEPVQKGRKSNSRAADGPRLTASDVAAVGMATPKAVKVPLWRKLFRQLNAGGAPGQDKLISSPLIIGLAAILVFLGIMGYALSIIVAKNKADKQYYQANASFDDKNYKQAVAQFDEFLTTNPSDLRAPRMRALRQLANIRQFTAPGTKSWNTALEAVQQALKTLGDDSASRDVRMDIAAEVLTSAEGLSETARVRADAGTLKEAEDALKLHEKVAGTPAKMLREKAKLPEKIELARAAVVKAQKRKDAIAKMAESVKGGSADTVFATRDGLVAEYPDMVNDREVVTQLEGASELVRKAVSFDPTTRPADTTPHVDPLGPPVSLIYRLVPPGAQPEQPTADGPVVFGLAEGYAYGLDGSNGAPLWHIPVGLSSPFPPIPVTGTPPTALLFDARYNDLVMIDGRTGKLVWRQVIGEAIQTPPLILGNQIVLATPSGKLLTLALNSGEIRGTLDFGRPLSGTPVADEAGQFFYVTGDRDCIYVVSREPTECVFATYLGHKPGSIRAAPARLADFLVIPQNGELWEGDWKVFMIEAGGEKLRFRQSVKIPGWTWQAPASQGTILWSLTDRNAVSAFGMGPDDAAEPLKLITSTTPDERPTGPAYARARNDREFWISATRLGRFDLDVERGSLTPSWTIERAGPAVGPIQVAGKLTVFSHQFEDGPGIALWGVDPTNGKVAWKTVIGAPWPLVPSVSPEGNVLTTLASDGPEVAISPDLLQTGGFVQMPLRRPGYFNLPPGPLRRLERDGLTILVPSPESDHLLVREGKTAEFQRVDLPAPLGAAPVFWGSDLFLPGLDGRAYLVDPRTGAAKAEPYVPTFEAEKPTRWRNPVFLQSESVILADEAGQVRRLARLTEPRLRLAVVGEPVDLKSTVDADPAPTSDAVVVSTLDNRVRSLSTRDLTSLGAWPLELPRAVGPMTFDNKHAVIIDKGGGVMVFGPDGNRMWASDLGDTPPVGPPLLKGENLWFVSRDGVVQKRTLADGTPVDRTELNILPAGGLWAIGNEVVLAASPGTVRLLRSTEANPTAGTPNP